MRHALNARSSARAMSNVLFVLYHDFSANSAVHVHNFANQLTVLGHQTAVAIPDGDDRGEGLGEQQYRVGHFQAINGDWTRVFANGRPPDIVHAWTPRENVRLFCDKMAGFCRFTLFVHLEDNEERILETKLGEPIEKLRASDGGFPNNLSHPRKYRRFIASADGVTMIMDRLEEFVPEAVPKLVLWPGADRSVFYPRRRDETLLATLGIAPKTVVFCYTGNVHSANAREVRSLYVAAAVLNREGTPAVLLRTGRDHCEFLGSDDAWVHDVSKNLGRIDYRDIPNILSLADALVQPGTADAFNDYRLPGKLPEFFAMGRPVILPRTNIGRFLRHGDHAWVLEKVDALAIVDTMRLLRRDEALRERLARGAIAFCDEYFDWVKNTAALDAFYRRVSDAKETNAGKANAIA